MALAVVIDTNILLVSVSERSPYYWLYKALLNKQYRLLVSTDLVLEYEEIIGQHMGSDVAHDVVNALERLSNVTHVHRYYRWRLIEHDKDDNKFVDCAIAGHADCIVTHDKHFDVLKNLDFPRVPIVSLEAFRDMLTAQAREEV